MFSCWTILFGPIWREKQYFSYILLLETKLFIKKTKIFVMRFLFRCFIVFKIRYLDFNLFRFGCYHEKNPKSCHLLGNLSNIHIYIYFIYIFNIRLILVILIYRVTLVDSMRSCKRINVYCQIILQIEEPLSINTCIPYNTLIIERRNSMFRKPFRSSILKIWKQSRGQIIFQYHYWEPMRFNHAWTNEIQSCLDQRDSIILGQMRFNHAWTTKNLLCICGSIFALVIWTIRYDQCEYVHNDTTVYNQQQHKLSMSLK